jgi:uncharacterized protein (DUF934 family)
MTTLIRDRRIVAAPPEERAIAVLEPHDDPASLVARLGELEVIAVRFPKHGDGRGYSIGRLLRERYGWKGELRAVGDIGRDLLQGLERCGFNAFELREGEDAQAALAAFEALSEAYQSTVTEPLPLFRRRAPAAGAAPARAHAGSRPSTPDAGARPLRVVFWGAQGAGKTSLATRLLSADHAARAALAARGLCLLPRTVQLADLFEGDEPLGNVVAESRGAGLAVVVLDVRARPELQAARFALAAQQAGIARIVVAVNKMDLAGYRQEAFRAARGSFLHGWLGPQPDFVPVSARHDELVFARGERIDWHAGATLAALIGLAPEEIAA